MNECQHTVLTLLPDGMYVHPPFSDKEVRVGVAEGFLPRPEEQYHGQGPDSHVPYKDQDGDHVPEVERMADFLLRRGTGVVLNNLSGVEMEVNLTI